METLYNLQNNFKLEKNNNNEDMYIFIKLLCIFISEFFLYAV